MVTLAETFTKQVIASWVIFLCKHDCFEVLTDSLKLPYAQAKARSVARALFFRQRAHCLPEATIIIQFFA